MSCYPAPSSQTIRARWSSLPQTVQVHIIKTLSIKTLSKIRRLPASRSTVNEELRRRWFTCLENARLDPPATRSMMLTTNTILSGSAALAMMMPGTCDPADLDFYCPRGFGVQVALFFYAAGYRLLPPPAGIRRGYGGMSLGLNFVVTMHHKDCSTRKLNIVESSTSSPHAPLLFFHSTVVMNFVAAEGFGMLYPTLTVAKKGLMNRVVDHANLQNLDGLAKYVKRGFTITDTCAHSGSHDLQRECFRAVRSSEDGHFLSVPFEDDGHVKIRPGIEWRLGTVANTKPFTVRVRVQNDDRTWAPIK